MKEKSTAKNHGGGIIAGAIIEKRSLRGNHWKENHREHLEGIWEASRRHLGGIQEGTENIPNGPLESLGKKLQMYYE